MPTPLQTLTEADFLQIAAAIFLWLALVLLAVFPVFAPRRWPLAGPGWNIKRLHRVFLLLLVAALFVWRAPELLFKAPYNVDEAHFLSVAQRFTTDGVAWRSADGVTAGPLDCYVLTWPALFGLPLTYFEARLTGIACLFVTIAFLIRSLSLIVGRRQSLLIVLAAVTFYLFAWQSDFIHYSSEHLPVALLSVSVWVLLALWRKPQWTSALALGFFLGAVPFTKLQASPIAIYLFAAAVVLMLLRPASRFAAPQDRLRMVLALFGGGLLVPAIIMVPVIATGTWPDFVHRYILIGVRYGSNMIFETPRSYLYLALGFILKGNALNLGLLVFGSLLLFIKLRLRIGRFHQEWLTGLAVVVGYLVVTVFAMLKPQISFTHYLLLLPGPLLLFAAWLMRGLWGGPQPFILPGHANSTTLAFWFLFICILPQAIIYPFHFYDRPHISDRPAPDPVTPAIMALSQPGDTLGIWGWAPDYFIRTGLHSATRDVVGFCVLMPGNDSDYYREAFLSDLQASKPRVFIDAAGTGIYPAGWLHPVEKARYTMYPPLAAYIDSHYHLQSEIAPAPGAPPVLIFVRSD